MAKKRMVVEAGPHARHDVHLHIPLARQTKARLFDEASGREVPCQLHHGELHWIVDDIAANAERSFVLETGRACAVGAPGVAAIRNGETIDFVVDGRPFATYNFGKQWARPFFYPVLGPEQVQITRNYPIAQGVPGETTDHPHHKSLWVAHGDVNGVDNWSEEKGHGTIVSKRLKEVADGPVLAVVRQDLVWLSNRRKPVVAEEREIRVYAVPPTERILDLTVTFRAKHGKATFGDTKEGGICSLRVASSMDGSHAGKIENSYGATTEAETWGRPAPWCDYSGPVNGKLVGIAVFDTPGNLRHPTYWHVRDYGLMTANPFGISHFKPESGERGDYVLEAGGELRFAYRVFMHRGDAATARVRDKYHDYVNPPKVRLERLKTR